MPPAVVQVYIYPRIIITTMYNTLYIQHIECPTRYLDWHSFVYSYVNTYVYCDMGGVELAQSEHSTCTSTIMWYATLLLI